MNRLTLQYKLEIMMKKILLPLTLLLCLGAIAAKAQMRFNGNVPGGLYASNEKRELMIPNAFSPNNDGQNDIFKISNLTNEQILEFKIFNRWGTILYKESDNAEGWDGTYRGEAQAIGVYGYVIRIKFSNGNIETYKGTVTLVR